MVLYAVIGGGVLLAGCHRASDTKLDVKPAAEKVAERGPLRLRVAIDRDHVAVAEPFRLTIETSAPDGYEIRMPAPGDALGGLRVRSARDMPEPGVSGTQQWRQEYQLESLISGDQTIPELTIHYRGPRAGAPAIQTEAKSGGHEHGPTTQTATQAASAPAFDVIEGDLSAGPLTVHVASALTGDADPSNLAHVRDIKGAVEVPVARSRRWIAWAGVALVLAATLNGLLLYRRWRRKHQPAPETPPGTWAFAELRRLEGERLVEQGLYHAFYSRLSDIVRQYIERRFSLMAPERTTEEFLREVRCSPALREEHQQLLRSFLESADMVKFALYEPGRDEAEKAFAAARNFVDETAYTPPSEPAAEAVAPQLPRRVLTENATSTVDR